jgi:metal-responsive CopG/Arc/MetJ family transcriptional regulator
MSQQKFGVSVSEETAEKLEELVDECTDLGASRSEIIDAILSAYLQSSDDEITRTRELLKRYRTERNQ